jgi:hypothetical protein
MQSRCNYHRPATQLQQTGMFLLFLLFLLFPNFFCRMNLPIRTPCSFFELNVPFIHHLALVARHEQCQGVTERITVSGFALALARLTRSQRRWRKGCPRRYAPTCFRSRKSMFFLFSKYSKFLNWLSRSDLRQRIHVLEIQLNVLKIPLHTQSQRVARGAWHSLALRAPPRWCKRVADMLIYNLDERREQRAGAKHGFDRIRRPSETCRACGPRRDHCYSIHKYTTRSRSVLGKNVTQRAGGG